MSDTELAEAPKTVSKFVRFAIIDAIHATHVADVEIAEEHLQSVLEASVDERLCLGQLKNGGKYKMMPFDDAENDADRNVSMTLEGLQRAYDRLYAPKPGASYFGFDRTNQVDEVLRQVHVLLHGSSIYFRVELADQLQWLLTNGVEYYKNYPGERAVYSIMGKLLDNRYRPSLYTAGQPIDGHRGHEADEEDEEDEDHVCGPGCNH